MRASARGLIVPGMNDDVEPTTDELLLELIDTVSLTFPEPLRTMTITFTKNEDGARPALTDLAGVARPGGVRRPELGHKDAEVLDAVNALLGDLARSTARAGGAAVLEGRIDVEGDGPDGETWVYLVEKGASPTDDRVRMKRRFDASELSWLFFTPALYEELAATEERERAQKAVLDAELSAFQKFVIDMVAGTITFAGLGGEASLPFQLVGSWAQGSSRFLWGWANDAIAPALRDGVERRRRAAVRPGLRAFTEPDLGGPEPLAERLARHAAVWMGARGLYRAPFSAAQAKGFMYLALF